MAVVEFPPMNKNAHQPVKTGNSPCAIVIRRLGHGSGRKHRSAGIEWQRNAKTVAQWRPDEIDPPPARRTEGIVVHDQARARPATMDTVPDGHADATPLPADDTMFRMPA